MWIVHRCVPAIHLPNVLPKRSAWHTEQSIADVVIARLSHTYGPGFTESDNRVYAQFIRNVLKGEDIVLKRR